MENMKFRVESPEHSEAIQKELFRLGFMWALIEPQKPRVTEEPFLFCSCYDNSITWCSARQEWFYNEHHYTETTLEELKLMKP